MDVDPRDINPDIVAIGRVNPIVKEYMALYLSEAPLKDGKPLSWRDTLELMVVKLSLQYVGALKGWKDQAARTEAVTRPNVPLLTDGSLVDENPTVESPEKVQLEIAKGMIAKLISPARRAWAHTNGKGRDFPPIQLSQSFIEQAEKLMDGNVDQYIQKNPCEKCGNHAFFIEDGERRCAVCDARSGKRRLQFQRQQFNIGLMELQNEGIKLNPRLVKLLNDYQRELAVGSKRANTTDETAEIPQ